MMQFCDKFATVSCLCVTAHAHTRRDSHQVLWTKRDESRLCQTALVGLPVAERRCQHFTPFKEFYPTDELAPVCG